jgi:hypothetical protein
MGLESHTASETHRLTDIHSTSDLNVVELVGRVATAPDVILDAPGARRLRVLVTTRSNHPRKRIDVIPVVFWDPCDDLVDGRLVSGTRVEVRGCLQRHVSETPEWSRSRLGVVGSSLIVARS